MPIAGAYNQKKNHGNGYNSGWPFYGEHGKTYSANNAAKVKYYDNKDAQRVITGTETRAAKRLNEPTRTNHFGIQVRTEGRTSHKK